VTTDEIERLEAWVDQRTNSRWFLFWRYGDHDFHWDSLYVYQYRPMPVTPSGDIVLTIPRIETYERAQAQVEAAWVEKESPVPYPLSWAPR
jgi:hypothetical protein